MIKRLIILLIILSIYSVIFCAEKNDVTALSAIKYTRLDTVDVVYGLENEDSTIDFYSGTAIRKILYIEGDWMKTQSELIEFKVYDKELKEVKPVFVQTKINIINEEKK